MSGLKLLCFVAAYSVVAASPIVLKRSSPSGETVIAISSSDPNVEKYITLNFPNENDKALRFNSEGDGARTFSTAVAGTNTSTGRNFGSFPFFLPFFNFPLNFEGFGLNFGPSWLKGVESYEPIGNGEVKTVTSTAVNDNGHVYGKVNTVTFDNTKDHP